MMTVKSSTQCFCRGMSISGVFGSDSYEGRLRYCSANIFQLLLFSWGIPPFAFSWAMKARRAMSNSGWSKPSDASVKASW